MSFAKDAQGGAWGLFVPGAGATVTRAGAIAALERGEVENALLGGRPSGRRKIRLGGDGSSALRILVTLPDPGSHPNTRRYLVAIVGGGYHGILTSSSTRIPGLVSIADITGTALALGEHESPPIRSRRAETDALFRLDNRLARAHHVRSPGLGIAAGLLAVFGAVAFLLRVRVLARAAAVFGAAAVSASVIVSAVGSERAAPVLLALAALALVLATLAQRPGPFVVAVLVTLLLVLVLDTPVNSFGPLGPHPEGGGRFYGLGNLEETLLLAPVLAAAIGRWFVPVGALALVTVGWSHAGADGGGMLVFLVALAVLALRLRGLALTPRRLALVAAGAVALGLVFVGLDAALGGSSHVTRAIGSGSVVGDIGHRLHLSYAVVTSSWHKEMLFLVSIGGMVWMAMHRDRGPLLEAMLAGVVVSLLVNDTPVDVAGIGALGSLALLAWERTRPAVDSRPMRRSLLVLPVAALALAGCGSEGTSRAAPETVEGTIQAEAPGKAIFLAQGCNGCHTYKPAGSAGTIGPDLGKLADYAKKAKQPVDKFVRESIVNPTAYTEKGFPKGAMPPYKSLPPSDLNDLVDFLTKPQG